MRHWCSGRLFLGAFGGTGYDRVVNASPDKVRSALMGLDIRNAPGEPGSDPSAAGDVAPLFQLTEQGNDMVWTVTSGKDVAVRMIAHLEPLEGGTKTRVTAEVQRGNAPDDFVSPAFRSTGMTLGLFGLVLEDELDALTRPAGLSPQECQDLAEKLFEANSFAINEAHTGGIAGAAKASMTNECHRPEAEVHGLRHRLQEVRRHARGADDGRLGLGFAANRTAAGRHPVRQTDDGSVAQSLKPSHFGTEFVSLSDIRIFPHRRLRSRSATPLYLARSGSGPIRTIKESDMRSVLLGSAALALAAMTITPAVAQSMGGSGSSNWQGHHRGGGHHDGHHGDRGRIKGFPTFPNLAIPDSARRLSHRGGRGSYGGDYGYGGYGYAYVDDNAFQSDGYNDWWHDRPDRAYPRWVQAQGRVDTACTPERMWWHGSTLSC